MPCRHRWGGLITCTFVVKCFLNMSEPALDAPAPVTLRYREVQPLNRDRLVVTVNYLRSNWYFEGADFEPVDDGWLVSRLLKLSASAGEHIGASLRKVSGTTDRTVAAGQIVLPNSAERALAGRYLRL